MLVEQVDKGVDKHILLVTVVLVNNTVFLVHKYTTLVAVVVVFMAQILAALKLELADKAVVEMELLYQQLLLNKELQTVAVAAVVLEIVVVNLLLAELVVLVSLS